MVVDSVNSESDENFLHPFYKAQLLGIIDSFLGEGTPASVKFLTQMIMNDTKVDQQMSIKLLNLLIEETEDVVIQDGYVIYK